MLGPRLDCTMAFSRLIMPRRSGAQQRTVAICNTWRMANCTMSTSLEDKHLRDKPLRASSQPGGERSGEMFRRKGRAHLTSANDAEKVYKSLYLPGIPALRW